MIVSIDLIRFVLKTYCTSSAESSPPVPAPDSNTIASVWQSDDDPSTIRASSYPLSLPIGFQGSCWCSNSERENWNRLSASRHVPSGVARRDSSLQRQDPDGSHHQDVVPLAEGSNSSSEICRFGRYGPGIPGA